MNYKDKFEKQISYSIDYGDLDDLIKEIYGVEFESALEQDNDTSLFISVDGQFDDYDETDFEFFLNSGEQGYNTLRILLNDMCRKDMIEPGLYIINICW